MTTSKRTTRGASTPPSPENGAAPPKARARPRKSPPRPTHAAAAHTYPSESHAVPPEAPHPSADRHASIALAAYFRSQHRGFKPGHEMEDWLAAEEEVDQRLRGEGRISGDSTG